MRLEKIALWRETGLFTEQADGSRGYLGFVRGAFAGDEISIDAGQLHIPAEAQYFRCLSQSRGENTGRNADGIYFRKSVRRYDRK